MSDLFVFLAWSKAYYYIELCLYIAIWTWCKIRLNGGEILLFFLKISIYNSVVTGEKSQINYFIMIPYLNM